MNNLPICPNCKSSEEIIYKYSINEFSIHFCKRCANGFTFPTPKSLSKYYHSTYWVFPGIIGLVRSKLYNFFQLRRKRWLQSHLKKGDILDVGAGEGLFSKSLPAAFQITNLDIPFAKVKNPSVLKRDFLKWQSNQKFDAIVFWESLEHTPTPLLYLQKSKLLLRPGGYIFVEYPVFNCFESTLFKKHWFHLDPPRHLVHMTVEGMNYLAKKAGFKVLLHQGIFAAEYVGAGFVASLVNLFQISSSKLASSNKIYLIIILIPVGLLSLIAEYIFFLFGQSPIRLIILTRKENET